MAMEERMRRDVYSHQDAHGHKRLFLCGFALDSHVQVPFGYLEKREETLKRSAR